MASAAEVKANMPWHYVKFEQLLHQVVCVRSKALAIIRAVNC